MFCIHPPLVVTCENDLFHMAGLVEVAIGLFVRYARVLML